MKITVKLEISKETGETYRSYSDGTCDDKEGVMVVNFGDVIGISIKNSLPDAVIKALGNMQGAWMPTGANKSDLPVIIESSDEPQEPTDLDRFAEKKETRKIERMIAVAIAEHEMDKHLPDAVYGPVSFREADAGINSDAFEHRVVELLKKHTVSLADLKEAFPDVERGEEVPDA